MKIKTGTDIDKARLMHMEPGITTQRLYRILKALEMGLVVASQGKKGVKVEVTPKGKFIEKELERFINSK